MGKILAIDVNKDNLTSLETIIQDVIPNSIIFTVSNDTDGIELAIEKDPDVILLDIDMSGMDGFEVCHRLKTNKKLEDIPVVFITSLSVNRDLRVKALSAGADAFLSKPIDGIELSKQVAAMVKIKSANRQNKIAMLQLIDELKKENQIRLKTEESLKESEIHYRTLADNGQALIWTSGLDKKCNYFNQPWLDFTGRTLEQELGDGWVDGVHPDDLEHCIKTYVEAFDRREKFSMEYRIRHSSGEYRWILDDGTPRYNTKGEFVGYIGHCLDITDHRHVVEALIRSEERFKMLFEKSPLGYQSLNEDGYLVEVNETWVDILGYSKEEASGKWFGDFLSEQYVEDFRKKFLLFRSLGKIHGESEMVKKDGNKILIEFDGRIAYTLSGESEQIHFVFKDITEQKKAEEELKNKNEFIQTVLDNLPIGVSLNKIDQGTALYLNKKFEEIYGWPEEELRDISTFFLKIYPDEAYRTELTTRIMADINSGDTSRMHWENCNIVHKDGSKHIVNAVNIPLYDQNIMVSTVFDITEQRRISDELIIAKEVAEENNRLKSAFLANMSHEIRTPMNAIMGFANLLSEAEETDKRYFADIVQKSSEQLLALIDDVILLSRLQSEKMRLNIGVLNPNKLVAEVIQMFDHPDLKKGLGLKFNFQGRYANLSIQSDSNKIKQVLTNLISNAIKYTHEGSVEVGFESHHGVIEFYVKDTGIGISEDEQDRIFDTFYRSEEVISSAIRGTGLGLNIAKELVSLMGGTIGVSSVLNEGSRFYFSIPVEPTFEEQIVNPLPQVMQQNIAGLTVLVADDELVNFQLIKILLKDKVKRIDHAINGKEAVELVLQNKYSLILMDLKMPVMGGIEATKILRAKYPNLPIIAQTAFTLPEDKKSALQAGCNDFISKPLRKEKLMEIMSKYS